MSDIDSNSSSITEHVRVFCRQRLQLQTPVGGPGGTGGDDCDCDYPDDYEDEADDEHAHNKSSTGSNNNSSNSNSNNNSNSNSNNVLSFTDANKCCIYTSSNANANAKAKSQKANTNQVFSFDACFPGTTGNHDGSGSTQEDVFREVAKPLVDSAIRGYSGTIVCYGCTGSGKTYTMRGKDSAAEKGLMPRCIESLLQGTGPETEIWVSYIQIYCEAITDLLTGSNAAVEGTSSTLQIRERAGAVYVEGLSRARITKLGDFMELLVRGDSNRVTAATNANETSSRSHAALIVTLISSVAGGAEGGKAANEKNESSLVMVDLAGSERASASTGRNYMRAEEAKAINLSLSALGNCIHALSEGSRHIPFRDSKLTRLLQCSLGGGSRLSVIVNVNVGPDPHGEILNTLRFAARASKVKVIAKVSRYIDYESLYNEAQARVDSLEQTIRSKDSDISRHIDSLESQRQEIEAAKDKERDLLRKVEELSKSLKASVGHNGSNGSDNSLGYVSATAVQSADGQQPQTNEEVARLTARYEEKIKSLTTRYEAKLKLGDKKLSESIAEVSELQNEVQDAREKHLATLKDMRGMQERLRNTENDSNGRVQELLAELQEKNSLIERMQEELSSDGSSKEDMVSRSKVLEMEGLFMATVSRLTDRVMQLERTRSTPPQRYHADDEHDGGNDDDDDWDLPVVPTPVNVGRSSNKATRMEPGGRIRSVNAPQQAQQHTTLNQSNSANSILLGGTSLGIGGKKLRN